MPTSSEGVGDACMQAVCENVSSQHLSLQRGCLGTPVGNRRQLRHHGALRPTSSAAGWRALWKAPVHHAGGGTSLLYTLAIYAFA